MPIKNTKELFVLLLSNVRNGAQRESAIYQEMVQLAQDQDIKEVLDARVFLTDRIVSTLDECFRLISEQPTKTLGRIQDTFVEEFRRELSDIQSSQARKVFILSKVQQLLHIRTGEYVALVAAAEASGDHGVGLLIESCLTDRLAFVKRTRRLIRHTIENRASAKFAA